MSAIFVGAAGLHFARPEEPVGKMLTHAGTKARSEGLPGVLLRLAYRLRHVETIGQERCDCRGKRATRAMIGAGEPLPRIAPPLALLVKQDIDDLRRVFVGSGHEH